MISRILLGCSVFLLLSSRAVFAFDVTPTFSPTVLQPTQTTRLRVTFLNNIESPVLGLTLSDALPPNMFIATPPNAVSSCGGGVTGSNSATEGTISVTGATIPAATTSDAGTCYVEISVFASTKGTYVNEIPANSASGTVAGFPDTNGTASNATFAATIQDMQAAMAIDIGGNTIQGGETVKRIITLTNPNDVALTGLSFTHDLNGDNGYNINANGPVTGTCGGTGTVTDQSPSSSKFDTTSTIVVSGALIPANGSCTIIYDIEPARIITREFDDTTLTHQITGGAITTNEGATNPTFNDPLRTVSGIEVDKTFDGLKFSEINTNTDSAADLGIEIINYNAAGLSGFDLVDTMPAGLSAVNVFRNTCGGTATTGTSGEEVRVTGATLGAAGAAPIAGLQAQICNIDARVEPDSPVNTTFINVIAGGDLNGFEFPDTSAELEVTNAIAGEDPLDVRKQFERNNIYPGESQTLTFTLTNTYDENLLNISFDDDLVVNMPSNSGMRIGNAGVISNTCQGSATATPNDTLISIAGVFLPIGQSCEVVVQVQMAADALTNRTIANTVTQAEITFDTVDETGRNPADRARDTIRVDRPIELYKSYEPASIVAGGQSQLTLTFQRNSRVGATTSNITFFDELPSGHTFADPANVQNGCGGTVTISPDRTRIDLNGGSLGPVPGTSLDCELTATVVAPNSVGSAVNTVFAGNTTATDGGQPAGLNQLVTSQDRSATLTRTEGELTLTKEFLTPTISGGEKSRVRITIANTEADSIALTGVELTDSFSGTELRLADDISPSFSDTSGNPNANGCGGGFFQTVLGAGGSITLTNGSVAAGVTCYFEFNTTSFQGGTITNTIPADAIISDQGTTNPFTVAASLVVERDLAVSKGFAPATVAPGDTSQAVITVINSSLINIIGSSTATPTLVDTLPAGLSVQGLPTTTCADASVIADTGSNPQQIILTGGTFPQESSCTISFTATALSPGAYANTIPPSALTTDSGATNVDPATGTLTVVEYPSLSKSFSPASIGNGEVSTVTVTLNNPNSAADLPAGLTGVSFSDVMTDMVLAAPPDVRGTCAPETFAASAGGASFLVSGLAIPPASSCTVQFDVTSTVAGTHPNQTTGATTDQTGGIGAPSNSVDLTVGAASVVTISKEFAADPVLPNTPTTLLFTLTNPNAGAAAIDPIGFSDTFPTSPGAMVVATDPRLYSTCDGAVLNLSGAAVAAGDTGIQLQGGTVPGNGTCTISVDIVASTPGSYTNTSTGLTTEYGTSAPATDTLSINGAPAMASSSEAVRTVRESDNDQVVNSVLGSGDTIGGQAAFVGGSGNVDLTITAIDGALSVNASTGLIVVAGGTGAGTYDVSYQICQAGNAGNCAPVRTESVEVVVATIIATTDYASGSPLTVLQADFTQEPGNVLGSSDTLDGVQATVAPGTGGNVDLTIQAISGPGGPTTALSVNVNTGIISVGSGTPAGLYQIDYQICEDDHKDNCATASEFVEVVILPIFAAAEADRDVTASDAAVSVGSLLGSGDTLDGSMVTVGPGADGSVDLAILSISDGIGPSTNVAVDTDSGLMVVAAGAPDGTYTVSYQICEEANRSNCATASEVITVTSRAIAAGSEPDRTVTGSDGPATAGSALSSAQDTLDGSAATLGGGGNVNLAVVAGSSDPELAIDPVTGLISVAAGTPEGAYQVTYEICEAQNTDNCATAVETVIVEDRPIAAASEATFEVFQANADQPTGTVLGSADLIDGAQAQGGFGGNVRLSELSSDAGLSLDTETGAIIVAGDTPVGTYSLSYQICELTNLDNCASAAETVNITRRPIAAASEADRASFASTSNVTLNSVLGAGDMLQGAQGVVGDNVVVSLGASDPELALNTSTGQIIVFANTPPGTYDIGYDMCEAANTFNCASSLERVVVSLSPIAAAPEAGFATTGADAVQVAGQVLGASTDLLQG
ncbi:MAG: hypothetical protein AAGH70_07760, partial [Pseudomonadota bacterium]